MTLKDQILKELDLFYLGTGGIGNWLTPESDDLIFNRLNNIANEPLSKVQLNQLLVRGHEAPVSDGFFRYYWCTNPQKHPYPVSLISEYESEWEKTSCIESLAHLKWGLYRLFVDGLIWWGNVRAAYRQLRSMTLQELNLLFTDKRFDTEMIRQRGSALPLNIIAKDDRYLISEMACKTYGDKPDTESELKKILINAYNAYRDGGGGNRITIRALLEGDIVKTKYASRQQEFLFSADEVLDESVETEREIEEKYQRISSMYIRSRNAAIENTKNYLSMVGDLDVYVATSMRTRNDFRHMAEVTEKIFSDSRLKDLQLRYFDPTLSAAAGHEDKGLIECLMVKCSKVLVYSAGEKESYGKDAEAAMALSLGKPVIFLCDHEQKSRFYREVHPLSRLIHFATGVAVGAMVTERVEEVAELIYRIFENKMEYELEQSKRGYLRLREKLTGSIVRLETNDKLLSETFWNHYHEK